MDAAPDSHALCLRASLPGAAGYLAAPAARLDDENILTSVSRLSWRRDPHGLPRVFFNTAIFAILLTSRKQPSASIVAARELARAPPRPMVMLVVLPASAMITMTPRFSLSRLTHSPSGPYSFLPAGSRYLRGWDWLLCLDSLWCWLLLTWLCYVIWFIIGSRQ